MQQVNFQVPPPSASETATSASVLLSQNPSSTSASAEPTAFNDQSNESSMQPRPKEPPTQPILPAPTKKERFLLIAADQGLGSPNERLNRVIQAKYEAGLLKPYNYVKGYARLSKWMDRK